MRLIDADELVRNIDELSKDAGFYRPIYERFSRHIKDAPTIDAVPVVRCKDCVHMREHFGARYCEVWTMFNGAGDDGFCNYGERKDGDG